MPDDVKKEALDKALKLVIDSLEQGKDFVEEQAPLLVNDIISYGRASTVAYMTAALILPTVAWTIARFLWRSQKDEDWGSSNDPQTFKAVIAIVTTIVAIVTTIGGCIVFCSLIDPCMQAWFAPRLYVLRQLKGLL